MFKCKIFIFLVFASSIAFGSPQLISNVSVAELSSQDTSWADQQAIRTIDSSGLLSGDCHDTNPNNMWQAKDATELDGHETNWIVWNMGGVYDLDRMQVWNYNRYSLDPAEWYTTYYGAKNVDIFVSMDTNPLVANWTRVANIDLTKAPHPATDTYNTPDTLYFNGQRARLVKMRINTNYISEFGWGGKWDKANMAGLSEVRFYGEQSSSIITNVSVNSFSSQVTSYGGRYAANTINSSGWSSSTGVHDNVPYHMWQAAVDDNTPWIIYNLNAEYSIDRLEIWNYNPVGEYDLGARDVDVYVSTASNPSQGDWVLASKTTLRRADGSNSYCTHDVVALNNIRARFIKMQLLNSYRLFDNQGASGLSEVRFWGKSPATYPLVKEKVIIDFNDVVGQSSNKASGFLFGMTSTKPIESIVDAVKPRFFRHVELPYGIFGSTDFDSYYNRIKSYNGQFLSIITREVWNSSSESHVVELVNEALLKNYVIWWDLFNEPDANYEYYLSGSALEDIQQFYLDWTSLYRIVKLADPNAIIVGPSYAIFDNTNGTNVKAFLTYANDPDLDGDTSDNVLPDVLSWHGWDPLLLEADIAEMTKWVTTHLCKPMKIIHINEYSYSTYHVIPGINMFYLDVLENESVTGACRACWVEPGLGGGSNCYSGTLNGLLTQDKYSLPRSIWWIYEGYGEITGELLRVERSMNVRGIAGKDDVKKWASLLLGTHRGVINGQMDVAVKNLQAAPYLLNDSNQVRVVAQRITNSGYEALVNTVQEFDGLYDVVDNSITISLNNFNEDQAYIINIYNPDGLCGYPEVGYDPADINKDCMIDMQDFWVIAEFWLQSN